MAKINLRPLDDRVVVQPNEAESTTAGGIVLARFSKGKTSTGYRRRRWAWTHAR